MKKLLIAVDGSPCSTKAVEHTARLFANDPEADITLFHVLPYVPTTFWDDGHILTPEERAEREKVIQKWLSNRMLQAQPIFDEAMEVLSANGLTAEQVTMKSVSDSTDVAGSIIEEGKAGGYSMLIMGRCGHGRKVHPFMGSVTIKVVNEGAGLAICIVE